MSNPCFACKSMVNQVFLVGYMGSGKSSVAKALSVNSGLPMIDLDEELERREGVPLRRCLLKREMAFRIKESDLLNEIAGNPGFPSWHAEGAPWAMRRMFTRCRLTAMWCGLIHL